MTPSTFTQPPPKPTTAGTSREAAASEPAQPEHAQAGGETTDQTEGDPNPHHPPDHHTETATAAAPETTAQHRPEGEQPPHQSQDATLKQPTHTHQPTNTDNFYDNRPLRGQTRTANWTHPTETQHQEIGAESPTAAATHYQHQHNEQPSQEHWEWGHPEQHDEATADRDREWGGSTPAEADHYQEWGGSTPAEDTAPEQQPSHEQWEWNYQEQQNEATTHHYQEWWENTQAATTEPDATHDQQSQQPSHEAWSWGDYGSKEATAAAERYRQRSRESPYERWQREHHERQRAEQNRQPTPTASPATTQQPEHSGEFGGLGDGRTLRGQRAEPQHNAENTQSTWYNQVRDHRQLGPRDWHWGEPWPTPSPAPTHETDRTDLMQRGSPSRATSSTTPPALSGDLKQALLTQLRLLRDTAMTIAGGEALTVMVDVAVQLVHTSSHVSGAGTRQRGRKRPFTEPNALAEIAAYANRAGGRSVPLPAHDMVEDLFFLIAELEAGGLQLHEPLPGTVQVDENTRSCATPTALPTPLGIRPRPKPAGEHCVEHTPILGGDPGPGATGSNAGRQTRRSLHD